MILVVDSDEVWPYELGWAVVQKQSVAKGIRQLRLPMIHYWRSFYRCVLHDPAYPVRVIYPKNQDGIDTYILGNQYKTLSINHFGYALPPAYIAYKWGGIHGHQNELRKDVDWFADKYMANAQTDCHPVGSDHWQPERVSPLDYMPSWMENHPFYHMSVIE